MLEHQIDHLVPINNVCNQKCNFCSAEYRMIWNKAIPLKAIFKQILEKWDYIQISWWEPLLSPDVYKILYFIRKNKPNCFVEFQTNWVFLNNENIDKLEKFGVNLYNVNYPCHVLEINDEITWLKWSLARRETWMKNLLKRWLKLRINIIINTLNVTYIPSMIDYISINFSWLDRVQFSFTKAMWAANKNDEVVPTYDETESYIVSALKKCKLYNIKVDVDHIPMCFLWEFYNNHVDYHKIKKGEQWVYLEEKNYVKKCQTCDKKLLCSWYRRDYLEIYPE